MARVQICALYKQLTIHGYILLATARKKSSIEYNCRKTTADTNNLRLLALALSRMKSYDMAQI